MIYNKLVRDKIPEIIAADGTAVTFRILNDEEYKAELERKLDEEIAEFHESKSIEELADVCEVLGALICALGYDGEQVKGEQFKKRFHRGGFDKKIFLVEVEEKERHKNG